MKTINKMKMQKGWAPLSILGLLLTSGSIQAAPLGEGKLDYSIILKRAENGVGETTVARFVPGVGTFRIQLPQDTTDTQCRLVRGESTQLDAVIIGQESSSPDVSKTADGKLEFTLKSDADEVRCQFSGSSDESEVKVSAHFAPSLTEVTSDLESNVKRLEQLVGRLQKQEGIDTITYSKIKQIPELGIELRGTTPVSAQSEKGIRFDLNVGEILEVENVTGRIGAEDQKKCTNVDADGCSRSSFSSSFLKQLDLDKNAPLSLFCGFYVSQPQVKGNPELVYKYSLTTTTWASRNNTLKVEAKEKGVVRCHVNWKPGDYDDLYGSFQMIATHYQKTGIIAKASKLLTQQQLLISNKINVVLTQARNEVEKASKLWIDQAEDSFMRNAEKARLIGLLKTDKVALDSHVEMISIEIRNIQKTLDAAVRETTEDSQRDYARIEALEAELKEKKNQRQALLQNIEELSMKIETVDKEMKASQAKAALEAQARAKQQGEALAALDAKRRKEVGAKQAEIESVQTERLFPVEMQAPFVPKAVRMSFTRSPRTGLIGKKEVTLSTFNLHIHDVFQTSLSEGQELTVTSKKVSGISNFETLEKYDANKLPSALQAEICVEDFAPVQKKLTQILSSIAKGRDSRGAQLVAAMKAWSKKSPRCETLTVGEQVEVTHFVRDVEAGFDHCSKKYADGSVIPYSVTAHYVWSDGEGNETSVNRTIFASDAEAKELKFLRDVGRGHIGRVGGTLECEVKESLEF